MFVKATVAACLLVGAASPALAQQPAATKPVQLIIGTSPGGGYDLWGRAIARRIGAHLPGNPTVVPQNMPGAGSLAAANYLYNVAPKDGSVFGIISLDTVITGLTTPVGVHFEALKFSWIGTPTWETNIAIAYETSKIRSIADLNETPLVVGGVGAGSGTSFYPRALEALLGLRFKVIDGYPSTPDVFLAMQRGEVDGILAAYSSIEQQRPEWIKGGKVRVLFQAGAEPNPDFPNTPFILDQAKTEAQRQALTLLFAGQGLGRPFVGPPNLTPEVFKTLRDAFAATMSDPDFIADVQKQKMMLKPKTGENLEALVKLLYQTPKPIVEQVAHFMEAK